MSCEYLPYLYSLPSLILLVVGTSGYNMSKRFVQEMLSVLNIKERMLEMKNMDFVLHDDNDVTLDA